MFEAVMASLPYAVPYEYVPFEKPDGSSAGNYDELTYQVFLQNFDGAVGDITITFKRAKYVDFTLPFAEGGVSMVVPVRFDDENNEWVFLKPLTKELWLTATALFILAGLALWILEHRFNNAYRGPPLQHAGMIFYFPFMALVFAQRERIVNNLARLVDVVWMFVVLILSSTYTASLSAKLTVQRLQPSVTDVKELISREDYAGCHKGSFMVDLLQELGFTYIYSKYCDKFMTVGPTYPCEGFAFVFPEGSLLVPDVSRAILELTDSGKKLEIEKQWIKNPACNGPDSMIASNSVSLQSFKTLFGITGLSSLYLARSDFYSANTNYSTRLVLHVRDSGGQVIDTAAAALSLIKEVQVDAIIGPQRSSQASFAIDLGDKANVPIISFSATSPSLHPRTPYFVQTALSDSARVDAIAAIVSYFHWNQVVLVGEDSDYGNGITPYLCNALQNVNVRVSYRSIIPLSATDDIMLRELYKMKTMETRIFVVHVTRSLGSRLFPLVKQAGMMVEGYVWIVTSGLMDLLYSLDPLVIETMQGVIGVKPLIPRSSKLSSTATRWKNKFLADNPDLSHAEFNLYGLWAYDTLWALAMAAERVGFREPTSLQNTTLQNYTSLFSTQVSRTGPKLLEAMLDVTFQGLGGNFHIVNGQLEASSFHILNVVGKGEREVGIWTTQGILSDNNINVTSSSGKKLKSIIFPGDSTVVPKGWEFPVSSKKLRIAVPVEPGNKEIVKLEKDSLTSNSKVIGCYIDMFDNVMASLPYPVLYEYVVFEKPDGSSAGTYDELSYQVFLQNFDGAVGYIAITYKRAKYVDFTLPFSEGGVSMVVPIMFDDKNNEWFFLKPLTKELWLTAIALFILTGMAVWILEHRFNNAYRGPPSQHAGLIFYFPFMSLVFAQREQIVSNSARLVVVVWMFVVLILSSTYTASLSARLTVQRLQPSVTDVKELIRRGDYVGCYKGSFTVDLLQGLGFDKSKIKTCDNRDNCAEALSRGSKKDGISALFYPKPFVELFLSQYHDKFMTVGPTYPTEGSAFVFPKGSPLVADVSRAILELTDSGKKLEIEKNCMKNRACNGPESMNTSDSVSLQSFKTLFGITGGITATCVVAFLVTYMYKNRDVVQRILSSDATFWSKVCAICKHFDERDTKHFQSKRGREDGEEDGLPNACVSPQSSTVVPISSEEMGDKANPEQTSDVEQSSTTTHLHLENTTC